jgi:dihydroorotate dehydrogenase electron transfer subunit
VQASVISNKSFFPGAQRSFDKRFVDIRLIWIECPGIAQEAKPGQFLMVRCGDLTLPRPLSIHQVKGNGIALFFSVLTEGKGTKWLSDRHPGETFQVFGPLGKGFSVDNSTRSVLLLAGGMGIAPLHFLAQTVSDKGLRAILLQGARTGKMLYPRNLLSTGIEVLNATEDGTEGKSGMITTLVKDHAGGVDQIFACGPVAMYRQMVENKTALGLEGIAVQVSLETVMGCGHGACYGCTIKTRHGLKQVCEDGPVFDLDDILWSELAAH